MKHRSQSILQLIYCKQGEGGKEERQGGGGKKQRYKSGRRTILSFCLPHCLRKTPLLVHGRATFRPIRLGLERVKSKWLLKLHYETNGTDGFPDLMAFCAKNIWTTQAYSCQKIIYYVAIHFLHRRITDSFNWLFTMSISIFGTEPVASGQYQISTHISVSDLYKQHDLGLFLLNWYRAAELIQIRFTVRYQTRCQKVLLRFWVQIWIRLVPLQNVRFCCVQLPVSIWKIIPTRCHRNKGEVEYIWTYLQQVSMRVVLNTLPMVNNQLHWCYARNRTFWQRNCIGSEKFWLCRFCSIYPISCKMMFPISYLVYSVNYFTCLLITYLVYS